MSLLTVFHQLDDVGAAVGHDTDKLGGHGILHAEELEQEEDMNSMSVVIDGNDLDVGEHIGCDDEMVIANSFCEVYIDFCKFNSFNYNFIYKFH